MLFPSPYRTLWLAGIFGSALSAQTAPEEVRPPAPPSVQSPAEPAPRVRAVPTPRRSEHETAALAGFAFEAPEKEKKTEELPEDVDLREIDRPRNQIIRLPKVVVQGERPPVFTEQEINTQKGLADIAVKRYLSSVHQALNRFTIPIIGMSNEQLALLMYQEDKRLEDMKDFGEKVYLLRQTGDTEGAADLKQDVQTTFMRKSEFSEPPGRR